MRVLHIFSGYGGGTSMLISNLAYEMPDEGIIFDTISFGSLPEKFRLLIEKTGGQCYLMKNPKREGWGAFKKSFSIPFKENTYHMVHCHMPGYRALAFYYLAKKYKIGRFIIHAHGKIQYGRPGLITNMKIGLDAFINRTLSERPVGCGKKAIRDIYGAKIRQDQMMIVPNGVDLGSIIKRRERRRDLRQKLLGDLSSKNAEMSLLDKDRERLLIFALVGRLRKVKNHIKFMDIAQMSKERAYPALFLIVGEGDDEEKLKKEVRDRNLADRVIFTGRIEPIADLYGAIDEIILPSFSEGLPTVALEAQAAGLPALISARVSDEVALIKESVEFLPLEAGADLWWDRAKDLALKKRPEEEEIKRIFDLKGFSRPRAGQIYAEFVRGERTTFSI